MTAPAPLQLLSAGAAQGLVLAVQGRFTDETGAALSARFGAVGAMQEALLAGAPCDVMILTEALAETLAAEGRLRVGTLATLGHVRTGIAVRTGEPRPDVSTPDALRAALLAAEAIYFPDALKSTAGMHFAKVMRELGVLAELEPRLRTFPNGATAMGELAASSGPRRIGCTQVTEIMYTAGVELVGTLPARFELATAYTAAVSATAADPVRAARLIALLTGPDSRALRAEGGFE